MQVRAIVDPACMTTSYKQKPPNGEYDVIVIGSGIGGLAAAAALAKHADMRVLVLERHWTAGGLTQSFSRPGYEWDVGVHYVGEVGGDGPLRKPFEQLTEGRLAWAPLPDIYDSVHIGDRVFDLPSGRKRFATSLSEKFPSERRAIERFVELIEDCRRASAAFFTAQALPPKLGAKVGGPLRDAFSAYAAKTTAEVVWSLTSDPVLRAVLTAHFGNYATPPRESSFAVHAGVVGNFIDGAWFPIGGAGAIARAFEPTIEAAGGAIYVSAEVEQVLAPDGVARGVRMIDGRELRAPLVISDAGVSTTFNRLLPNPTPPKLGPSHAHACLYLGFAASDEELGLHGTNMWMYPDENHDENCARFYEDPDARIPFVYASFPSAKDPSFRDRHPGHATVDLLTVARWEWFERWADRSWRRRGADYDAFKASLSSRMLEVLFAKLPQLRGRVDCMELSTPLSTRDFTGHARGEMAGLDHTPARFANPPSPRTSIRNLFLSGQDVAIVGVAGAFLGGMLAASAAGGMSVMRDVMWDPSVTA